jgi:hypothetical protein
MIKLPTDICAIIEKEDESMNWGLRLWGLRAGDDPAIEC